jgi:hypothetical protein
MHACIHAARSLIRNNRIELSLASAHTCSGCIIARDPHVEDEDEDPFLSDDYRSFLYKCRQRQAMRAWGAQGACMHETDLRNGRGRHSARTVDEGVTVKRTSLSLSLSLSLFLSLSLARSLARSRALSLCATDLGSAQLDANGGGGNRSCAQAGASALPGPCLPHVCCRAPSPGPHVAVAL